MADPILTRLEAAIKSLIEGMDTDGGYNYDWGTCREEDLALSETYPIATEILILNESNDDPENGVHASAYENKCNIQIVVVGKMTADNSDPNDSINVEHNKALDDLKKLFGTNYSVSDTVNAILYTGMERQIQQNGDRFVPGRMITNWQVSYSQDRTDPTVNAN